MQRYATTAEVEIIYPLAGTLPAETVAFALDAAAAMVDLEQWGATASLGHAYLTAHFLALGAGGSTAAAGAVTRRKIKDLEEEYAAPVAGTDGELSSTSYGARFALLRSTIAAFPVAGRWP